MTFFGCYFNRYMYELAESLHHHYSLNHQVNLDVFVQKISINL